MRPNSPTLADPAALRRARAAIFGIFAVNGFLLAAWVVHIPAISERTGISHATLGWLLLLLAGGALVGMQVAGPLADRYGSRLMVILAGVFISFGVIGPGLATDAVWLGVALTVFGFGNGALDVSMNSQAVHAERLYRRPIMSAFHAFFSVGSVVGSLLGAAALAAGWPPLTSLTVAAAIGFVTVVGCCPFLLPHVAPDHPAQDHATRPRPAAGTSRKVLALGALAFALFLSEGAANDWSTLQVKEHLGTSDATAALAFGAFALMMTVGRFGADRVSAALGPVAVVRYGTLIAAAGIGMVVVSGWVWLTLAGWALFGLGLSGCIPQIFTAAGNLSVGSAGVNMSRVVGMGYVGLLAGPALLGWLTELMPLTATMLVPLAFVLLASRYAGQVRRSPRAPVELDARN
ncbi:MFS transporter [Rhodococcus maanshanensis]|uniref:Fucose permease n=1 Tax=Rhodococcus maanshanensis TaxID=183556 RepID=A0A1H7PHG9_9NOCA|nr:MFS transporter [Rhodococcus maanshanensis]SEL34884.1 Fucose permease [Rhodococcus maanshanensis]